MWLASTCIFKAVLHASLVLLNISKKYFHKNLQNSTHSFIAMYDNMWKREEVGPTNHSGFRRKKWQGKWASPGTHTVWATQDLKNSKREKKQHSPKKKIPSSERKIGNVCSVVREKTEATSLNFWDIQVDSWPCCNPKTSVLMSNSKSLLSF